MTVDVNWDGAAFLKKQHTRVLMKWREHTYRVSGYNYYEYGPHKDEQIFYDPLGSGYRYVSLAQIKAELATREHVPNKKEARVLRQQRAKRNRL